MLLLLSEMRTASNSIREILGNHVRIPKVELLRSLEFGYPIDWSLWLDRVSARYEAMQFQRHQIRHLSEDDRNLFVGRVSRLVWLSRVDKEAQYHSWKVALANDSWLIGRESASNRIVPVVDPNHMKWMISTWENDEKVMSSWFPDTIPRLSIQYEDFVANIDGISEQLRKFVESTTTAVAT